MRAREPRNLPETESGSSSDRSGPEEIPDSDQGKTYAAFIEGELKAERERRVALDTRGLAVVTSSGTLVTLLAGLGAFVTTNKTFVFPGEAAAPLAVALLAFATAASLGILASRNRYYDVALGETLTGMIEDHWGDDETDARNNVAYINIKSTETLRQGNGRKADLVTAAMFAQLAALVLLSVVILIVVSRAH